MKKLAAVMVVLGVIVMLGGCVAQVVAEEPTNPIATQATTTQETLTEPAIPEAILASFMANLDAVKEFLGTPELKIAEEDIAFYGDFVTAQGNYNGHPVFLTFRHHSRQQTDYHGGQQWTLLEYGMNGLRGPGFLDAGYWVWERDNEERFVEPFTMRFYRHYDNWPEPRYSYVEEEILPENWQAQIVDNMLEHTGIRLANLWFERDLLVVNLTPAGAMPFDWGSTGSALRGSNLFDSLFSLHGVTEIEILVGGQRGLVSCHSSFAGTFRRPLP